MKDLLLVTYLLFHYQVISERLQDLGWSAKTIAFALLLMISTAALWLAGRSPSALTRQAYALLFLAASTTTLAYEQSTASYLTYNAFISLTHASAFAQEAAIQFIRPLSSAFLISLLLYFATVLKPIPSHFRSHSAIPLLIFLSITAMMYLRGGDGARGLPAPVSTIAYSGLNLAESMSFMGAPAISEPIKHSGSPNKQDIVLIMDESISPLHLDINTPGGANTNLRQPRAGTEIFNYGLAAAATNCSAESNLTIRYGGTREKYLQYIFNAPTIWEYALKAGMNTVYIDAQRTSNGLQNGMKRREREQINELIQFDNTPVLQRDMAAIEKLSGYLKNDRADFIFLNNVGAHFPIHDKYPDEFMIYKPALPRGLFGDISDTGSREGFSGSIRDWELYRNSYKNTLSWNVGEFFKTLFDSNDLRNTVIIYTSDHGQDLREHGGDGVHTHCTSSPDVKEGVVPLVVIQGLAERTLTWQHNHQENVNSASHYNIFPTLLKLMGYDPEEISRHYGRTLDQVTEDDMTLNIRFHARLGKDPIWKKIEPSSLLPPDNEHL